jgi:hypothetical protein
MYYVCLLWRIHLMSVWYAGLKLWCLVSLQMY